MVFTRDWKRRDGFHGVLVWEDEQVLETVGGDGGTAMKMYLMTLNHLLTYG